MAMRFYFTDTHNVVEGAGAAGLAAALKEKELIRGKRIGLVATGGNVDHVSSPGFFKISKVRCAHKR